MNFLSTDCCKAGPITFRFVSFRSRKVPRRLVDSICNLGLVFFDGIEEGKGDRYHSAYLSTVLF